MNKCQRCHKILNDDSFLCIKCHSEFINGG
jgi:RNA polymerase subunit RPABC4/transcription elongation factor Spt4